MTGERVRTPGAASEPVTLHPGIEAREAAREAEIERWALRRMRAIRAFYTHLTIYAVANFALLIADVFMPGEPWFFYPLLGWGLGLGMHAAQTYERLPWFTRSWEERKLQDLIGEAHRR
jgi:hypothetical protein